MDNITIETVNDNNIEQCRELCNELMLYQKSKAIIAPDAFDGMNFDTRLPSPIEWTVITCIALTVLAYGVSMLVAWRIRRISAYSLISE